MSSKMHATYGTFFHNDATYHTLFYFIFASTGRYLPIYWNTTTTVRSHPMPCVPACNRMPVYTCTSTSRHTLHNFYKAIRYVTRVFIIGSYLFSYDLHVHVCAPLNTLAHRPVVQIERRLPCFFGYHR